MSKLSGRAQWNTANARLANKPFDDLFAPKAEKGQDMSALDKVLEAYRDMFGVRSDKANELHRDACIEVARLRARLERLERVAKLAERFFSVYDKRPAPSVYEVQKALMEFRDSLKELE